MPREQRQDRHIYLDTEKLVSVGKRSWMEKSQCVYCIRLNMEAGLLDRAQQKYHVYSKKAALANPSKSSLYKEAVFEL